MFGNQSRRAHSDSISPSQASVSLLALKASELGQGLVATTSMLVLEVSTIAQR